MKIVKRALVTVKRSAGASIVDRQFAQANVFSGPPLAVGFAQQTVSPHSAIDSHKKFGIAALQRRPILLAEQETIEHRDRRDHRGADIPEKSGVWAAAFHNET